MVLEQKQLLLQGCRILADFGVFDLHGHLSVRTSPQGDTIVINARSSPSTVRLTDFVAFDLDDGGYPDEAPGETTLHAQVYRTRSDVVAVCHNHSPFAVAVSSVGIEMSPVHPDGAIQTSPIPLYDDYHEEDGLLVTTDEEGREVADALGDDVAIMLRGHGALVTGRSIADVIANSIKLEFNARLLYYQAQLGEPWYLPRKLVEREVEHVHSDGVIRKSLDYYLSTVGSS